MEWTQERIEALFLSVEENQHLDYKDGRFLRRDCQDALTKQIVGFANSDGGTLIIGVEEGKNNQKHLAVGFAPCDGVEWSKERLEILIDSNISPRIPGITIYPVRLDGDVNKSVYVIDIPKGTTCHQSSDGRYYFRLNFSTEVMRDFQIRDVMNRQKSTRLELSLRVQNEKYLDVGIHNKGSMICRNWSLTFAIPQLALEIAQGFYSPIIQPSSSYVGLRKAEVDFGEIASPLKVLIHEKPCHIFKCDKLRLDKAEAIFPRSRLEVVDIRTESVNREHLAVYWQIDSDDGRRSYGLLSPRGSEVHEQNSLVTNDASYVEL